ncbi:MAG: NHLP bacteriocin export ABC transporter permease/ATPase subunit, partial [Chloroflexi bacterium]
ADRSQLLQLALILFVAAVVAVFFQVVRNIAVLRIEIKLDHALQSAVWDRLISLPTPFFRNYTAGDLSNRAMAISAIRRALSGTVVLALLTAIFSIFNFLLLFIVDLRLAIAATILVLVIFIVTLVSGYWQMRYRRRQAEEQGRISGMILQFITGISKLRVAAVEHRAFAHWARAFARQRRLAFAAGNMENSLAVFNAFFPLLASIIVFAMVSSADISTGVFLAFNAAFTQFLLAGLQLALAITSILDIVPLYERLKPVIQTEPEVDESKSDPGDLSGEIEVSRLSFRYVSDGPLILSDVSFHVNPGEFVALVGPSGSGKSTLLRLLLGFEKPESGGIFYDGQDLSGLDIRLVRQQLGVVLQNSQLMTGDIFTNIIGVAPLTIDDAWEAARMAGLEEDIRNMPMGMHTLLSEGGSTLSGGQRQRLLIARAIAQKPRILFFDEATSALDNRTQAVVSASLERLDATRIVIAHRLSTIINADRIIVLQNGRIVQMGTYDELMKQPGLFVDLARRQLI